MTKRRWLSVVAVVSIVVITIAGVFFARRALSPTLNVHDVASTPPLGWNSWNTFGCDINADLIKHTADAMASNGMAAAGYRYVIVDDCWAAPERGADGALRADPQRFPDGMAAIGEYVHKRGLKFGLYSTPQQRTCAQLGGGYPGRSGSRGNERQDAQTFASWGVDYLKYDWCAGRAPIREQRSRFDRMGAAVAATGRPIVFSINPNSGVGGVPPAATNSFRENATMARLTNDVYARWKIGQGPGTSQGIAEIIAALGRSIDSSGGGYWVDPDMLEVGVNSVGGIPIRPLTTAESQSQLAMWAMFGAPLIAGNDIARSTTETVALLTNPVVLAIDQDQGGQRPRSSEPDSSVWTRQLADSSLAVALYNEGDSPRTIGFDPASKGITAGCWLDAWTLRTHPIDGTISADVPPHGTTLLRVIPHTANCQSPPSIMPPN